MENPADSKKSMEDMSDPSRKRAMDEEQEPVEQPSAKKHKVGSNKFGGFSVPIARNSWWKFGEIQREMIQSIADKKKPNGTIDGSNASQQTSSVQTVETSSNPVVASRVVSADNISHHPSKHSSSSQQVDRGISNVIESLQQSRLNHTSHVSNGFGLNQSLPPQLRISSAFFRPEQVYNPDTHGMGRSNNTAVEHAVDDLSDDDCSEDSSSLKFRTYQAENWTEKFEEMIEFRNLFGHCLVPNAFPENPALAQWVKRQRYQYKLKLEGKRSTMSDERVAALEEVGFVWDSHSAIWSERLQDLIDYKQVNGHCNVPSRYADNRQLAIWVKRQRRQYKFYCENKPSSMTEERIQRLNAIGFAWDLKVKKDA